jgi:uncharacterized protein YdiU (UPF0061 family)
MPVTSRYHADPQFHDLGPEFADPVAAADFPTVTERFWNERWALDLGLGNLEPDERARYFARFETLPDNQTSPLAMRYHGHQFRSYNPEIGDGRGFLHAQVRDEKGRLLDFATKGSGQTPFSRTADGRLTLKGAVREILAAEMLEALGVYTSKPFAVFETGEALVRHDEPSPARSAVLTRLGHSHIRFGTFQRHAFEQSPERIEALIEHAITQYYPELAGASDHAACLLEAVAAACARLTASWMAAGFVHGVLNTDNLNVTGESFDYGPWRFLPHYEPGFTAAYFDQNGLYAYGRQPEAVFWALQQFAGALSLAGNRLSLEAALNVYPAVYRRALLEAFCSRFGIVPRGDKLDEPMLRAFLAFMQSAPHSWEGVIFDWFGGAASRNRAMKSPRAGIYAGEKFEIWHELLMQHEPSRPERLEHDYFAGDEPVSMTIDVVEKTWSQIADHDDWTGLETVLDRVGEARNGYDLGQGRAGFL